MKYDYAFVRLGRKQVNSDEYQDVVHARAADGWRLVTILAPGDLFGAPKHMDLIFERPRS